MVATASSVMAAKSESPRRPRAGFTAEASLPRMPLVVVGVLSVMGCLSGESGPSRLRLVFLALPGMDKPGKWGTGRCSRSRPGTLANRNRLAPDTGYRAVKKLLQKCERANGDVAFLPILLSAAVPLHHACSRGENLGLGGWTMRSAAKLAIWKEVWNWLTDGRSIGGRSCPATGTSPPCGGRS